MNLYPLFHWSPAERREAIRSQGLQPYSYPVTHTTQDHRFHYICLSPTPSMGWGLSGAMEWVSEVDDWDLWQVEIPPKAEVHVRPQWGPTIEEVKVYSPIPVDYIWYVGTRTVPFAEEIKKPKSKPKQKTKKK